MGELPYAVYALRDPRTRHLRYVGKTKQPLKVRLRRHLKDAKERAPDGSWADNTHRANWLRDLLADGLEPSLIEICRYETLERVNKAEKMIIKGFRSVDTPESALTNTTEGGDGGIASRKPACTDEDVLELHRQGYGSKKIAKLLKTCPKRVLRVLKEHGEKSLTVKKVVVDDLGNRFDSVSSAAIHYGVTIGAVSNQLCGKSHLCAGRKFRYVTE